MNKKSLLVTGGFGNLGSWIVQEASKTLDVTILTKNHRSVNISGDHKVIFADLADPKSIKDAVSDFKFNYIIHAGSVNDGFVESYKTLSYEVNSFGTRNLLEALNISELKHFIYLSTFQVYGAYSGIINEKTLPDPKNDYALSHLIAEHFISRIMPKNSFSTIRLTNSYGCPKDFKSSKWYLVLNDLSKQAFINQCIKLSGNGKAVRDFIWMGDVVVGLVELLKTVPENDFYNLSQGRSTSMLEVARKVQKAYENYKGIILPIETNTNDDSSHDQSLNAESNKIRKKIFIGNSDKMVEEAIEIFKFLDNR